MKNQIRCAIYTRKSSEEGLEQDFNSLDAQRESCENYIKSQQHEGWVLIEKQYNDGGFSGGTLERPALKELLEDIENDEVDTVVVYKVDRLTRSLMDFSKIVELFDKHNASFVSITQHFNTTTSMGRLTLNILLSFAQFEREVTGERIRDKFAASKKKGMWMGGIVPIGYKREDKKLIIEEESAQKIKLIFEKYIELKSVAILKEYLEQQCIKTRTDKNFSKGHIYKILSNKLYIGKIVHKENVYEGIHESIVNDEIFNQTQKILEKNRVDNICGEKKESHSLLAGLLYDDKGNKMSPSHSNTRKKKYRYYISQAITQSRKNDVGSVSKIPAGEIENFVKEEIKKFVKCPKTIHKYIEHYDVTKQKELLEKLKNIEPFITTHFIRTILYKVIIYKDKIEMQLCRQSLLKALEMILSGEDIIQTDKKNTDDLIELTKDIKITQTTNSGSIVILGADNKKPSYNLPLIKAIVKSHYYHKLLLEGKVKGVNDIQKLEGLKDNTYIKDVLNLKFLPPGLTEQILNGAQSTNLNLQKLFSRD